MSLIYRALNKSRSETATQLNHVLLDMGTDGAQIPIRKSRKNVNKRKNSNGRKRTSRKKETPKSNLQVSAKNGRKGGGKRKTVETISLIKLLHPRRKGGKKRKTSLLSISILGSILAATIAFYYVCNYTNIIPQFNRGKEVEIRLKDDIDSSLYAKASKENVPVSVESIQDLPKAELQPVENLEGTNKDVLINLPKVQDNDAVEVMPSSVTNVPAVEGQIVEYFEAETQIPEREVKQEVQVLPEQLQDLEGIQYIAKAELQPVENLEGTNKDPLIELPQVQSNNLAQSAPSSLTNVMQPTQEIASPIEVQPVEYVEYVDAETLIREDEIEQEAQVLSERPQSNDDWYASYHFGLGVFYQKNNEIEKATEEYNKIIELAPGNAEVHINLGVIYKDRGDLDRAVEEYEKALAIDPWLDVGHNNLGVVYFLEGNYAEAIRHYQKAIEINPKNLEGYVNLGIAYGMQKRGDEAVKAFQTAISINPRHAETQYNLAVIYDENGEIEKAVHYYSKFLEFYPATRSELVDKVKRRMDVLLHRLKANPPQSPFSKGGFMGD